MRRRVKMFRGLALGAWGLGLGAWGLEKLALDLGLAPRFRPLLGLLPSGSGGSLFKLDEPSISQAPSPKPQAPLEWIPMGAYSTSSMELDPADLAEDVHRLLDDLSRRRPAIRHSFLCIQHRNRSWDMYLMLAYAFGAFTVFVVLL